MRLTLRTLLGWLDDVLLPEDHAVIGKRVSGSRIATGFVGRIRDLVARPDVGAPFGGGHSITADPNHVAEYLDNALASAHLADFERVCVESETHLAEVAACHRMLAELSRKHLTTRALSALADAGLKDRTQWLLAWTLVRKADEVIAATETKARATAAGESRKTARALLQALVDDTAAHHEGVLPDDGDFAVPAWPAWRQGDVGALIAMGLHGANAVAKTVCVPAREATGSSSGGTEAGGRGAFLAWATTGFAFALVLTLAGTLASSMLTARDFEPEVGCYRCTEP
jgi:hypothetical protein